MFYVHASVKMKACSIFPLDYMQAVNTGAQRVVHSLQSKSLLFIDVKQNFYRFFNTCLQQILALKVPQDIFDNFFC